MAGLPLPLRALTFPLVLLTLMTFVVMPVVTRMPLARSLLIGRGWVDPVGGVDPVVRAGAAGRPDSPP